MKLRLCALLIAALAAGNVAAADLETARTLLREGKPAEAYALLESAEFDQAGDIAFDTLLGIAALDSGKPDKATLAFERVLAQAPGSAGTRLDMGRAYFALGDLPRARQELNTAATMNPPPAARVVIDRYLAAIDAKEREQRTVITGYGEAFTGYDDNITSVVSDFTGAVLATYNLPGFRPTGNAVKRSSALLGVGGGIDVVHKLDGSLSLYAGADARRRELLDAHNYSGSQLDLRAGAAYAWGDSTLRGGVVAQGFRQRTDMPTADRNTVGVNAEWRSMLGERDQGSLFAMAARQRYPDIAVNDLDSVTVGAGWLHVCDSKYKPMLYASIFAGNDNARNPLANGSDNSKHNVGGRLYGQLALDDRNDLYASAGLLYRRDRTANARSPMIAYGGDHIADAALGWTWRPAQQWSVRSQLAYSQARSSIRLSEYKRTEATVSVRYDF